jgi:monofunctional biosynthetic peptidoglycan transglycosylase
VKKPKPDKKPAVAKRRPRAWVVWLFKLTGIAIVTYYTLCLIVMVLLIWIDPPFTAVHAQRRIESWFAKKGAPRYTKRYQFVPLWKISRHLQHAVIAAEDGRFYQHNGIDYAEMRKVLAESRDRFRGGSTISMQLVKNLFVTTHRNPVRKFIEWTLVYPAQFILGKQRILELYLNVIEWGPGIYGAETAARYHYRTSAAALDREQAARLAAIVPGPRTRRPARMNQYSVDIQQRMALLGW